MSSPADYFYPCSKVALIRHNEGLAVSVVNDYHNRETFIIPIIIPGFIADLGYNTDAPLIAARIAMFYGIVIVIKLNDITYLQH